MTFGGFFVSVDAESFFFDLSLDFDFLTGDACSGSGGATVFAELPGTGGKTGVTLTAWVLELSTRAFLDFLTGVATTSSLLGVAFSTSPCLRFLAAFGVSDLDLAAEMLGIGGAWAISTSSSSDASTPTLPVAPLVTPNGW